MLFVKMVDGLTALVIDDEPDVKSLFVDVLQSEGVTTDSVATTREGLDLLARKSYSIVITDLKQNPTGTEVYRYAREKGMHAYIATGGADPIVIGEARKVAGENILMKPINIDQLADIVKKVKERSQS